MIQIIIIVILIIILVFVSYFSFKEQLTNNTEKLDVAVIVEPRKHKYLIPVLKNFIKNLPEDTPIQIFHGTDNIEFIKAGVRKYLDSGKIIMTNLNEKNLTIKKYNQLLTNRNFWNSINGENILIFQTDTCLCGKNKHKLYDFLKYDYVGGPWGGRWKHVSETGGNGGLSFRKKTKMLEVCYKFKDWCLEKHRSYPPNEDVFLSKQKSFNYPKKEEAKKYFVETIYYPHPFGVHKPWANLKKNEMNKLIKNCPEIRKIFRK